MTFTVPYQRETGWREGDFINGQVTVRYTIDYSSSGKRERGVYFVSVPESKQESPEQLDKELQELIVFAADDVSVKFGVERSKVQCEYGNGGIVVTLDDMPPEVTS